MKVKFSEISNLKEQLNARNKKTIIDDAISYSKFKEFKMTKSSDDKLVFENLKWKSEVWSVFKSLLKYYVYLIIGLIIVILSVFIDDSYDPLMFIGVLIFIYAILIRLELKKINKKIIFQGLTVTELNILNLKKNSFNTSFFRNESLCDKHTIFISSNLNPSQYMVILLFEINEAKSYFANINDDLLLDYFKKNQIIIEGNPLVNHLNDLLDTIPRNQSDIVIVDYQDEVKKLIDNIEHHIYLAVEKNGLRKIKYDDLGINIDYDNQLIKLNLKITKSYIKRHEYTGI